MALSAGTQLGPYKILAPLGAGGMGEVYRARDTRLGRDVAVKVLPDHLSGSSEDRARFQREAKTISSLNHPHICSLFDVGREGDTDFLVMELVDGETLTRRIARGPMPIAEVVRIGKQIADALSQAHRAGVVHRDLKPGNVMLTKAGAKLMDFGLARGIRSSLGGRGDATEALHSSRTEEPITARGQVVGTIQYMAPEQLEGRQVDARTDIWALGCVLYEMATGKRAFEGSTPISVISAIMRDQPRVLTELVPLTPPALERLVMACLAKDPEDRVQTAHDVSLQLAWIGEGSSKAIPTPVSRRRIPLAIVGAITAVAAVVLALVAIRLGGGRTGGDEVRFEVPIPAELATIQSPELSPDGRLLAFVGVDSTAAGQLWLRPLNAVSAQPIPGTTGATEPIWSPDSRSIAFFSGGILKRISLTDGSSQIVCTDSSGYGGTWGTRGVILYERFPSTELWSVAATGGVPSKVLPAGSSGTQPLGTSFEMPRFLPDGRHFLYLEEKGGEYAVKLGDLESSETRTVGLDAGVEYAPPGYIMFFRDQVLMAQPFDARGGRLTGAAVPALGGSSVPGAELSVSGNGSLAFHASPGFGTGPRRLVWADRDGHEIRSVGEPADYAIMALSPRGDVLAVVRDRNIWMVDLERGVSSPFTHGLFNGSPVWSPDGSRLVFCSQQSGGKLELHERPVGGSGQEAAVTHADMPLNPSDYSPDGRYIALVTFKDNANYGIWLLPMSGERKPRPYLTTGSTLYYYKDARFSPDGKLLAYSSSESGRWEVFVQEFPGPGGRWQVSPSGGRDPQWRRDGRELFYLSPEGNVTAVPMTSAPEVHVGIPKTLFLAYRASDGFVGRNYAVSADGQRFLILRPARGVNPPPIEVVLNWKPNQGKQ